MALGILPACRPVQSVLLARKLHLIRCPFWATWHVLHARHVLRAYQFKEIQGNSQGKDIGVPCLPFDFGSCGFYPSAAVTHLLHVSEGRRSNWRPMGRCLN